MSIVCIIPARFASTRYPGKPLARLRGASGVELTLIERSWRAATACNRFDAIYVATDDARISAEVERFGGQVLMTSTDARNGTERCAEACRQLDDVEDGVEIVVNLQGDAPLTPAWFLDALIDAIEGKPDHQVATPVLRCDGETLAALKADRAAGRVGGTTAVQDREGSALYFSKEVVPFTADDFAPSAPTPVFHHVGVYAYRKAALEAYQNWPVGTLETLEGLEQLRFLENGHKVACVEVEARGHKFWELNNPEDIPRIESFLSEMGMD